MPKQPPSIKFFEEKPMNLPPEGESLLTRFIRTSSMGLIRTEGQASLIALIILIAAGLVTYYYVQSQKPHLPTTTFDILPQESVGSSQGLPKSPSYEPR